MVFNCSACNKEFKTKVNFDKHAILCDFKHNSLKQQELDVEFDKELPNQQTMYKLLLDLGVKYNKLEDKYNEINKFVSNKKRKVDVVQWLNANKKPTTTFVKLIDCVTITTADIELLTVESAHDILVKILNRSIYFDATPVSAFVEKNNILYVYDNEVWNEMKREQLTNFLNMIQFKMSKTLFEMKRVNKQEILGNDTTATKFDKITNKLMSIDFDNIALSNRIRLSIYNQLKTELNYVIELE